MVVFILERVSPSLRGQLSRWMIEPKAGVFVGRMPGIVRDKVWEQIGKKAKNGAATLLYSYPNEQGFAVRVIGEAARTLIEMEGLVLVRIPKPIKEVAELADKEQEIAKNSQPVDAHEIEN